jgi:hypothetical protein
MNNIYIYIYIYGHAIHHIGCHLDQPGAVWTESGNQPGTIQPDRVLPRA